jgi:hypothetical protein
LAATLLTVVQVAAFGADAPTIQELLPDLPFGEADRSAVVAGKVVTAPVDETSERELGVAMALLLKAPIKTLAADIRDASKAQATNPDIKAMGEISGAGTTDAFKGLVLAPDGAKEASRYLEAEAGDDFNLSAAEIAAFQAMAGASKAQVEDQLRKNLLARYQSYQAKGLAGIAPYERSDGPFDPATDLRAATEGSKVVKKRFPDFYKLLLQYPNAKPEGLEESFHWQVYDLDGRPNLVLTHRMVLPVGDAYVAASRQYYASRGYNVVQEVAALLPVKEGALLLYANRTSTDQVAGFGSTAKHKIGRGVMGKQLEAIMARAQKEAGQ